MGKIAPELWAIDMDRTLVDLKPVIDRLMFVCLQVGGIDTEALETARKSSELAGGSFDVLGELKRRETPAKKILRVQEVFAANEEHDQLLYPDARAFLGRLDETSTPHIIPTFGSQDWQQAKLEATGLARRAYVITPEKYKGKLIDSWRDDVDGLYRVQATGGQALVAHTVKLVDDKADAFRGLPGDCYGYHLVRPDEARVASQMGELPENANCISSLSELLTSVTSV